MVQKLHIAHECGHSSSCWSFIAEVAYMCWEYRLHLSPAVQLVLFHRSLHPLSRHMCSWKDLLQLGFFFTVRDNIWQYTWGDPKETRLVSMPPNAEEWEKDVSACSLDPQLSVARWTSSCNNSIGRMVSFREGSFCDPVEIMMCDLKEQRTCLKFCFLLGKTPTESLEMLQEAFKEQALSRAWVFEWFSRFKKGDLSIKHQPRSGRPSSSRNDENIAKIHEKLNEDRRYTIDELSEVTGVS